MKKFLTLIFMCTAMTLTGCRAFNVYDRDGMVKENTYTQISQDEAKAMMSSDSGYVIVDVRTVDEFSSGHIPNAICIPNEDITTSKPELLPDINQEIFSVLQKRKAEQGGGSTACRHGLHKCVRIWRDHRLDRRDSNRVGELSI